MRAAWEVFSSQRVQTNVLEEYAVSMGVREPPAGGGQGLRVSLSFFS